ncbi:MAG: flagellin N-terminal helical domain-containing protein [Campylobacter sp.]
MRMTGQLQNFNNMYNYQRNMSALNKLTSRLSSGLKIDNSYDDSTIYNDGMRLDYETSTLKQIQTVTSKARNFSINSDNTLSEIKKQLEQFKVKLTQAANQVHSETSRMALANDLQGIKNHLVNLANTSINGQFLFSGTAINTKPINGNTNEYFGNSQKMNVVGGAGINLPYNVDGKELFMGRDKDYSKKISTNTHLKDNSLADRNKKVYINEEHKMKNLIGFDYVKDQKKIQDSDFGGSTAKKFQDTTFFLQGKKPDGTSFTSKFKMTHDASMKDLLEKIGEEYGNTQTNKVVEVTINNEGQINVRNLTKGNQVIDFHMVGVTKKIQSANPINNGEVDAASNAFNGVTSLKDLQNLVKDANGNIKDDYVVTEFVKSNYTDIDGKKTDAFDFDKVKFKNDGRHVTGTVSQVSRVTGEYATDNTKISEVVGTKEQYKNALGEIDSDKTYKLEGQEIKMKIKSKSGFTYDVSIKFGPATPPETSGKAQLKITGGNGGAVNYSGPVWDASYDDTITPPVSRGIETKSKDMTFKQLNDIVAMVASDNVPAGAGGDTQEDFKKFKNALETTKGSVEANMDHRGRIKVTDRQNTNTPIEVTAYDGVNSDKFNGDRNNQGTGSVFNFSANNAVEIDSPSVDMFSDLDAMIKAVKLGQYRADSETSDPRNPGIQGALERIDHIADHISKIHTTMGAISNNLKETNERASIMEVNVKSVKSEIVDADYGKTYMQMMQKTMSYQAMLQSVAKINQLSLLNYM